MVVIFNPASEACKSAFCIAILSRINIWIVWDRNFTLAIVIHTNTVDKSQVGPALSDQNETYFSQLDFVNY